MQHSPRHPWFTTRNQLLLAILALTIGVDGLNTYRREHKNRREEWLANGTPNPLTSHTEALALHQELWDRLDEFMATAPVFLVTEKPEVFARFHKTFPNIQIDQNIRHLDWDESVNVDELLKTSEISGKNGISFRYPGEEKLIIIPRDRLETIKQYLAMQCYFHDVGRVPSIEIAFHRNQGVSSAMAVGRNVLTLSIHDIVGKDLGKVLAICGHELTHRLQLTGNTNIRSAADLDALCGHDVERNADTAMLRNFPDYLSLVREFVSSAIKYDVIDQESETHPSHKNRIELLIKVFAADTQLPEKTRRNFEKTLRDYNKWMHSKLDTDFDMWQHYLECRKKARRLGLLEGEYQQEAPSWAAGMAQKARNNPWHDRPTEPDTGAPHRS